jgi:predicted dehydrogenase
LDQVISVFGKPDRVVYDVRQLLGEGRLNDYFDIDLFYGVLKVSIKSSFFRLKPRPSYVVYGKKGMFIKETKDKQEEHLKLFVWPNVDGFGVDNVKEYGTLTFIDDNKNFHEEKVISEVGDYGRYYDALYNTIVYGAEKLVKDEETLWQLDILETGISGLK